jgi:hypothetical protein
MSDSPVAPGLRLRIGSLAKLDTLRVLAEFLVVAACTLAFVFTVLDIGTAVLKTNAAGKRDFIEYWASGQQLRHHGNPYDGSAILPMEHAAGLPAEVPPMVMGNAPSALPLMVPLGFVGARLGDLLWILFLLACLAAAVRMVWAAHGSPNNKLHYLGYTFGPALMCLAVGQISLLILLGYVLFQRRHRSSPFLAGVSLWFCALKPQLFLPFGLVLLAWIVVSKSYRILAGAVTAFAATTSIAYLLAPHAWTQYHTMMAASRYDKLPIPCLSIVLRRTISPDAMWLQYLPAALGCLWAIEYFRRHRHHWDWIDHGSPLILVSVLVAPYTWLIDQAILVPALLHGVYVTRSRGLLAVLALATAVTETAPLLGFKLLHSPFYLWTAPMWLVWYLCATRSTRPEPDGEDAASPRQSRFSSLQQPQGNEV